MYGKGEFILVPTFKMYKTLMEYIRHAGLAARQDHETLRRPLTSVRYFVDP